jgi:hypothetical protein
MAAPGIGAPATALGGILSGVGDVFLCFARALGDEERTQLIANLDMLISKIEKSDPLRAVVPKALLSMIEPAGPVRLRVIAGGKRARRPEHLDLDPDVAAGRPPPRRRR